MSSQRAPARRGGRLPANEERPCLRYFGTTQAVSTSTVTVGDLEFRYRSAGPPDGEAIIALHGFPETSISFTTLLEAGGAAGYRVIAPDQRGYSPGARPDPADTSSYYYDKIVDDVIAIASALGIERFHLVAHDHGCLVGWCVAARYPQHVATYVPMSVPHPDAFSEAMVSDPEQQVASREHPLSAAAKPASHHHCLTASDQAGQTGVVVI